MPILRYFVVAGLMLLGCLFAADYFVPNRADVATAVREADDALANWRASEKRKSVHARSAETNNFTQSFAAFAPAPAFGISVHSELAPDARADLYVSVRGDRSDNKADAKAVAAKPLAQDAPRKSRRQVAQAQTGRIFVPQPSADSLRQDAIARQAFAQQRQAAFAQPQWPQMQPQMREANARMQSPFGPRLW